MRDAFIAILAVVIGMLYFQNIAFRNELSQREVIYKKFLAQKTKGKAVGDYIVPGSLAVVAWENGRIVCGALPIKDK